MGQMPSVLNQNLSQQLPFQNPIEEVANINNVEHDYPRPLYDIINDTYDVCIVGAGPAGLMLATSLLRLGRHSVLIIDQSPTPTTAGRADGIQSRTLEVLKNMWPLGRQLEERASASYERTFWDPTPDGKGIERSRRVLSFPKELEIENGGTLGLQQGLIEQAFLRDMETRGGRVTRGWRFKSVVEGNTGQGVEVEFVKWDGKSEGRTKKVKAKYCVGCDGGRSSVRAFLEVHHGVQMNGDWVDTLWGAIDAVVKSDFPDLRKIAAIHSPSHGAMYIFPREPSTTTGQPLIRLYTQLNKSPSLAHLTKLGAREGKERVTKEDIMQADKEIIKPWKLEFERVEWWTAYPIGQRLVSRYSSMDNRVFLAGDACHTHSPKAGQGMNTALMDAHNLSFKMHYVLSGMGKKDVLLEDYHSERWEVGNRLIQFDMEYSALFSGEVPKNTPEVASYGPEQLKAHFANVQRRNAAFTTGAGVSYSEGPTVIPNERLHARLGIEGLDSLKLKAGWRLTPAKVTRCVNTQRVDLIHEIQFDSPGGFRMYVFTGDVDKNWGVLKMLSEYVTKDPRAFVNRFRGVIKGRKVPDVMNTGMIGYEEVNPYFGILTVVKKGAFEFGMEDWVGMKGVNCALYADDQEGGVVVGGVHEKYGLEEGGIVVVRPDGYVGVVVPLSVQGWTSLESYFGGFLKECGDGF